MKKEVKDMTWDELSDLAAKEDAWRNDVLCRILLSLIRIEKHLGIREEELE